RIPIPRLEQRISLQSTLCYDCCGGRADGPAQRSAACGCAPDSSGRPSASSASLSHTLFIRWPNQGRAGRADWATLAATPFYSSKTNSLYTPQFTSHRPVEADQEKGLERRSSQAAQ